MTRRKGKAMKRTKRTVTVRWARRGRAGSGDRSRWVWIGRLCIGVAASHAAALIDARAINVELTRLAAKGKR